MRDFGVDPVQLDVDPEGYDGPSSHVAPFLHRSGWLRISQARFVMPFITWRRTLIACVTDDGAVLPRSVASKLFSMPTSSPRAPEEWPPDDLDAVTDDLYADFLGRTDGDNLLYLEEAKEQGEARIGAFDARATALLAKMDAVTRGLRMERRKMDAASSQRLAIDVKLDRLDAMCDDLAREMRQRAVGIRRETDTLEADILAALRGEGELEHRTTVRWRCLPRRWGGPVRLDVHRREAEMWSVVVRDQSTLVTGWWR